MTLSELLAALASNTMVPGTDGVDYTTRTSDRIINLIRVLDENDTSTVEIEVLDLDGAPEASFTIRENTLQ